MDKATNAKQIDTALTALGFSETTRLLVIAQSGVETAMGTSGKAAQVFNYWNISAGSLWKGKTFDGPDTEPDGKGGWKPIVQHWRAYGDVAEAVKDYIAFLSMPRYAKAKAALLAGNTDLFVQELHAATYFTWPVNDFTDAKGHHSGYLSMLKGQMALAKTLLGK